MGDVYVHILEVVDPCAPNSDTFASHSLSYTLPTSNQGNCFHVAAPSRRFPGHNESFYYRPVRNACFDCRTVGWLLSEVTFDRFRLRASDHR